MVYEEKILNKISYMTYNFSIQQSLMDYNFSMTCMKNRIQKIQQKSLNAEFNKQNRIWTNWNNTLKKCLMLNLNPRFQYICLHAIQYACNNYERFDGLFAISTISVVSLHVRNLFKLSNPLCARSKKAKLY